MAEETLPFAPLVEQNILTQPINQPTPSDATISDLNATAKQSFENYQYYKQADQAISNAQPGDGGWAPKAIATLAALSGNFGPLMQLEEQKRKTQAGVQTRDGVTKIQELSNRGQWEEAIDLTNKLASQIGPRAPELLPVLKGISDKALEKQAQWESSKNLQKYYSELYKDQPDHPNKKMVDLWGKMNATRSPIALESQRDIVKQLQLHVQNIDKTITATNTMTGQTQFTPTPRFNTDIEEDVLRSTAAKFNLQPADIYNLMNDKPVIDEKGRDLSKLPGFKETVGNALNEYRAEKRQIELAGKVPISPELAGTLDKVLADQGYPPAVRAQIHARREYTAEQWDKARALTPEQAGQISEAQLRAERRLPAIDSRVPKYVIDPVTHQYRRDMSAEQAEAAGYPALTKDENDKFLPMVQLENKLKLIAEILPTLPNTTDKLGRLDSYVEKKLSDIFGYDADTVGTRTVQIMLKDALEKYGNSDKISADRYRALTAPLTDANASKESGQEVVKQISNFLNIDINSMLKQGEGNRAAGREGDVSLLKGSAGQGWDKRGTKDAALIRQQANSIATQAAQQYGVRPSFVHKIMENETGNGIYTTHQPNDGYGPMQIVKSTAVDLAKGLGVSVDQVINDPATNIRAGTLYLSQLLKKHNGDEWLAARDYNGHPQNKEYYAKTVTGVDGPGKAMQSQLKAVEKLADKLPKPPTAKSTPEEDKIYRDANLTKEEKAAGVDITKKGKKFIVE